MIDRLIGNYRIVEKVGEGGMGDVYRALDLMLDREVAIKAIRPELARDPEIVERFRAEARMLARVNHPAIATIYSFFADGEDLFLAMEFVRGQSLSRLLRSSGALPWERAVPLFAVALDGIEQAHRAGIVHRDLKPDNLMITGPGAVKVMDFGIARLIGSGRLTRTGLLIGTLHYMAPEQIRGEEVDRRTDVYALGIMLYEIVAGRVPFDAGSDYAVLKAQVEHEPAPPSAAMPGLPAWLDAGILKALAKDPGQRFQTVEEMRLFLLGHGALPGPQAPAAPPVSAGHDVGPALPAASIAGASIAHLPTLVKTPAAAGATPPPSSTPAAAPPIPPLAALSPAPSPVSGAGSYRELQLPAGIEAGRRRPVLRLAAALALVAVLAVIVTAAVLQRRGQAAAGGRTLIAVARPESRADASGPQGGPAVARAVEATPATPPNTVGEPAAAAPAEPAQPRSRRSRRPPDVVASSPRRETATSEAPARPGEASAHPSDQAEAVPVPVPAGQQGATEADPTTGGLPTAELNRLGAEMEGESDEIRNLYSELLSQKEKGGSSASRSDDRLKDELKEFQNAAERFHGQFRAGFFSRTRIRVGRLTHHEDAHAQIVRMARALVDSGSRVDGLMGEVKPDSSVRLLWHRIRGQWKRVAQLCGLE